MVYHPLRTNVPLSHGMVRAQYAAPPPDLAPYLTEFYQYEVPSERLCVPVQIYPSGVTVLRFDIQDSDVEASLYGPSLSPHMRGLFFCDVPIFGVAIEPTRAYHLLGLSVAELRDLRIQLEVLWPRTTPALKQRLQSAAGFHERVAAVSAFLRTILRPGAPDPEFLLAFDALVASHGTAPVGQACSRGTSARTVRRLFARYAGLSPKQTARVIRFQHLLGVLASSGSGQATVGFAGIAHDAGYSDQAHMIRDFAELVGVPPGRYLSYLPRIDDVELDIWSALDRATRQPSEPPVRRLDRPKTGTV
ncbi:MAG: helix-turn-helix domain-containing protein [Myxococcales bacterium]|nr:helix-turn-helix domain-containing protein [Myxococcales bacterium]